MIEQTTIPPEAAQLEAMLSQERNPDAVVAGLGSVATGAALEITDPELEAFMSGDMTPDQVMARLNAPDAPDGPMAEDSGRVHDIGAAYEAAHAENFSRDYDAAVAENLRFDIEAAHAEALIEDKVRTEAKQAAPAETEAEAPKQAPAEAALVGAAPKASETAAAQEASSNPVIDKVVKEAGYADGYKAIEVDDKIVVVGVNQRGQNEVMVASKNGEAPAERYRVNEDGSIVSITQKGDTKEYKSIDQASDAERAGHEEKELLKIVAEHLGIKHVEKLVRIG